MKYSIDFTKGNGLVPVIIQDYKTGNILMLGYMNEEAVKKTLETDWVYFWSRSRKKLWMKGEESGDKLKVKEMYSDCDNDAILIRVELIGKNVCHTGNKSCFYKYNFVLDAEWFDDAHHINFEFDPELVEG